MDTQIATLALLKEITEPDALEAINASLAADGTLTVTTPTGHGYDSTPPPLHEPRTQRPPADEPPPF
ncbi:hypothetical protein [Amycolatopsis regifaucium]|uniref:hypothetical protein n=1 Tax=Amycolatopsis regifaucium TaxID=546365 RepID=UPI000A55B0F7